MATVMSSPDTFTELDAELAALSVENDRGIREILPHLQGEAEILSTKAHLADRHATLTPNDTQYVKKLEVYSQCLATYCMWQKNMINKLTLKNEYLEDKNSADKQIVIETLMRQLNEIRSLTNDTTELDKTLTELHGQRQQPAADERHQGIFVSSFSVESDLCSNSNST